MRCVICRTFLSSATFPRGTVLVHREVVQASAMSYSLGNVPCQWRSCLICWVVLFLGFESPESKVSLWTTASSSPLISSLHTISPTFRICHKRPSTHHSDVLFLPLIADHRLHITTPSRAYLAQIPPRASVFLHYLPSLESPDFLIVHRRTRLSGRFCMCFGELYFGWKVRMFVLYKDLPTTPYCLCLSPARIQGALSCAGGSGAQLYMERGPSWLAGKRQ